MANDRDRAIMDYAVLTLQVVHPGIIRPEAEAANFEMKPVMFQMLQTVGQFNGLPNKDPHLHLKLFLEVNDAFKIAGATQDTLRIRLFPYSLRDRARAWLNSLPSDSITTWNELADKFIMKYFPPTKNQMELCYPNCTLKLMKFWRELPTITISGHQLDNQQQEEQHGLSNMVKAMTSAPAAVKQVAELSCVYCTEEHEFDNCPGNRASVNYESMLQQPNHQDTDVRGQAAATMEGNQPVHAEKEVATRVVTTYNRPNEQSLVPLEATQQFRYPPHFPQRFQKQKQDKQFSKFLEVLKQLHINIPFVEALEQMPNYVKFLKDILGRKRRLREFETVALTQESSHMLQSKIPKKMKDPGSFTIPCSIGTRYNGRALCDLGASINLMPLYVFKQLGAEECRPTIVTLQLADRSHAYPERKIEDVLVKVDKFIFPVDFIVLDFEADKEVPIILGRPFLAIGKTLIDVQKGELTMRTESTDAAVMRSSKLPPLRALKKKMLQQTR
ncbi:hypothetical protein KPL71_014560 [Citrus sinensis]|uniref:Uncharacterized protein n=1 Tax=Citrus sinensis TaxID=2711 RepID=A0ACB8KCG6_CITSI|nr:hypothetical protein KPL71_014560 [Citrus sinensis]